MSKGKGGERREAGRREGHYHHNIVVMFVFVTMTYG